MSPRLRLVLTIIFTAGFLVTAPLVILYTAGYRYDWRKQRVQKTGIIQTDSVPDQARVFLNARDTGRFTPYPLTRLLPEEYRVRFEKEGYFPWEKTVVVRSGETTFVIDAALVRDAPSALVHADEATVAAFTEDGSRVAYVREGEGGSELVTLALRRRGAAAAPAVLARYSPDAFASPRLLWSPDGRSLLTIAGAGADREIIRYDVAETGASLALHASVSDPLSAAWSDDGSRIVLTAAEGVFLADPQDGAVEPAAYLANARSATLVGRSLYVLRAAGDGIALERRGIAPGSTADVIASLPLGGLTFMPSQAPYLLIADGTRGRIMIVSTDDGSIVETLSATEAHWRADGRDARILACNDFEMSVADPGTGSRQLVTRVGTSIDGCAWHPEGFTAFYAAGGTIHAIDLDPRGPKNVHALVHAPDFAGFAADAEDGMLRFFGTAGAANGVYERPY